MKLFVAAMLVASALSFELDIVEIAKQEYESRYGMKFDYADVINFPLPSRDEFEAFVKEHGKVYGSETEKDMRFNVFQINAWIGQALTATDLGTATYGITKFADMTNTEFKQFYTNKLMKQATVPFQQAEIPKMEAPTSVDWRTKNAVTAVKDQGQCGSCWAFSATGNIEGQWAINKGKLISLSEAQIVDCDTVDQGCNGGWQTSAYQYIMKAGGIETEQDYPYVPQDGTCKAQKSKFVVELTGHESISKDEGEMATWCASNGPIAIAINADVMQLYKGGISHPNKQNCNPEELDHGVLIVGYGTDNKVPFWIVKNSWGKSWGEEGYYRVYRGGGVCGLNTSCTSSKV